MRIHVTINGPLRHPFGASAVTLEVPAAATIHGVLRAQVQLADAEIRQVVVLHNGAHAALHTPLCEDDRVDLYLPVGGG
ncbi:MAG: MoaD/ThiS family protein [bacterium]|nr:MoaD/ThiS family protein [bacterium]